MYRHVLSDPTTSREYACSVDQALSGMDMHVFKDLPSALQILPLTSVLIDASAMPTSGIFQEFASSALMEASGTDSLVLLILTVGRTLSSTHPARDASAIAISTISLVFASNARKILSGMEPNVSRSRRHAHQTLRSTSQAQDVTAFQGSS